ncbi:hypothetical protein [Burkholderia ubonensis]|uniref:hypothetical protein n=1 Tax=Burkholderia ubonensis TaxID=101571 RepID=UPI001E2E79A4|nr:hypothetical protein [Burkholderia ubonensis]
MDADVHDDRDGRRQVAGKQGGKNTKRIHAPRRRTYCDEVSVGHSGSNPRIVYVQQYACPRLHVAKSAARI